MPNSQSRNISDADLFKSNAWVEEIKRLNMRAAVVGNQKDQYLVLVLLAEDPIDEATEKLFFECLQNDRIYDPHKEEVRFKESRVILNFSAIYRRETIELDDLTRLFDTSKELSLPVRYLGENQVHAFHSDRIVGLCEGQVQSLDDVETIFSARMDLSDGKDFWQDFSLPEGPAAVRDEDCLRLSRA